MDSVFLTIVVFLLVLAVFDLIVGVSNDAVNFLNSAIGARVARFRTIIIVASIGIVLGAAFSNGMMDVARHGVLTPMYFSFYDVMCVFLAVMLTDVILLDTFNSLGMPTSTTVSMVFELLGAAFAIAVIKILRGESMGDGTLLTLGDLLNTEKAMSVVFSIFLSVAIAFVLGLLVQWISRLVFSFAYCGADASQTSQGASLTDGLKLGIFSGLCSTGVVWFLLINGLKGTTLMTPALHTFIEQHTWSLVSVLLLLSSGVMTVLSLLRFRVLRFVVLFGTFALAMAFAGNDLVNFLGVPLAGLDAYRDYVAHGQGNPDGFLMHSLMYSAQTPTLYLLLAGVIMVLALVFSKKVQNVVKTSVDLSRQDESDEMFGASGVARTLVRTTYRVSSTITGYMPTPLLQWIDTRFNADEVRLAPGAAFDQIRACVNLVLAGMLVALGTSLKLPLSTTYVTFMVAMGASLADRAWNRESAVFRITGVLSVIGGWFITAGVAFILSYLMTNLLFFGHFPVMIIAMVLAVFMLVRSNVKSKHSEADTSTDHAFQQMLSVRDETERWMLLRAYVRSNNAAQLDYVCDCYAQSVEAFFNEDYRQLKQAYNSMEEQRKRHKRLRRREIIALRRINHLLAIERNTWYFHSNNALSQMLYSLKRIIEPCREHVANNFTPPCSLYADRFQSYSKLIILQLQRAAQMLHVQDLSQADALREDAAQLYRQLSLFHKTIIDNMQAEQMNIEAMSLLLHLVQESQELLRELRHVSRGMKRFLA